MDKLIETFIIFQVHYVTLACLVWLWMRREQQIVVQQPQDQVIHRKLKFYSFSLITSAMRNFLTLFITF
jgi:hypothetical protein